jgi:glutaredoxin
VPLGEPSASTAAVSSQAVRDDSPDLLITWVDETGDFRVAQKPTDVPVAARERVRVVRTTDPAGSPDMFTIADLRTPKADGTYPTSTITRTAWEELGASRRKSRLEAMAPRPAMSTPTQDQEAAGNQVVATIYGAKWCKACRETARYLGQKGISYLEKDVDESPVIQAELRAKLSTAHLPPTSSIPVVDIGGRIIVGFSPQQIDGAVAALRAGMKP